MFQEVAMDKTFLIENSKKDKRLNLKSTVKRMLTNADIVQKFSYVGGV